MNILERPLSAGAKHNSPKLIIIHAMAEYIRDPDPVMAVNFLSEYKLSVHKLGFPSGDVMTCRDDDQGAYHARGYNQDSLGYEFLVEGDYDYHAFLDAIKTNYTTPEQWESGIEIVRNWMGLYNIDSDHVKRHSDISPGRKVDPGTGFDWIAFKKEISKS